MRVLHLRGTVHEMTPQYFNSFSTGKSELSRCNAVGTIEWVWGQRGPEGRADQGMPPVSLGSSVSFGKNKRTLTLETGFRWYLASLGGAIPSVLFATLLDHLRCPREACCPHSR